MQSACMQVGLAAAVRHHLATSQSGRFAWLAYLKLGRLQDYCRKTCITDLQEQVCHPLQHMHRIPYLNKSPAWLAIGPAQCVCLSSREIGLSIAQQQLTSLLGMCSLLARPILGVQQSFDRA